MKARFVGDPNDHGSGPERITVFGVEFVKGEWTTVTNRRLRTHSHFEFKDGEHSVPAEQPVRKGKGRSSGRP